MNDIVQFKVLDERNAAETPTPNISLYFPFQYQKSLFNRYHAQLFYAPSATLSTISIGLVKGSQFAEGTISFKLQAFNAADTVNYGLDVSTGSASLISSATIDVAQLPLYETYNETLYLTQQAQFQDIAFTSISVTRGSWYWLVADCGRVYNSTIGGFTIPDVFFLMTKPGFNPIGSVETIPVLPTVYTDVFKVDGTSAVLPKNTGVSKTETGAWNFTDDVQDHIILVNSESLVKFGYSLDSSNFNGNGWTDGYSLYANTGWQLSGVKDFSITDTSIGGDYLDGEKIVYIRFYRKLGDHEQSCLVTSNINYLPRIPIVTEVIAEYIRKYEA